jgi:hypothetical protein
MPHVRRKVAQTLLHLAQERCGEDQLNKINEVVIPGIIHQDEIGAYIGAERETVNRKLCEFKGKKYITYIKSKNGSEITILNQKGLRRSARESVKRHTKKKRKILIER